MKRAFLIFGLFLTTFVIVNAQTRVVLSKFPPYPGDNELQRAMTRYPEGQVFLDLPYHQLVLVRYGAEDEIETFRFDLANDLNEL